MLLRMCLRSPGMLIGALIMAININAKLALILAVIMPVMVVTMVFVLKKGFPRFGIMQTKIDGLNTSIQENLTNVRVVKSFVREEYQNEKFQEANRDLKKAGLSAMNVVILTMPLMNFFMNFTSLAVVWFGGKQVMIGSMQIGDLTAFVTYITQILSSLMMLSMIFMNASRAMASSKRLREVLDETIDLNDENAKYPERKVTEGRIEFKNVNFRYYKNSQEKVLDQVSLTIEPGQTVGIIGSTGCGKTTLVSMIPRLYDADEGQILVEGIDVRDYKLKNLRDGEEKRAFLRQH